MLEILFDAHQEGRWFQGLHPRLQSATLSPFPIAPSGLLADVLSYDRPDIVLLDDGQPILVLERTIEVPSGHNVGQRFARLAAAAQCRIPTVYFGPYAAYKHGGATQGPRYMNLRLFYALESLIEVENAAVTTIRWPVDDQYEVILTDAKDHRIIEYMDLFFLLYDELGLPDMNLALRESDFEREQEAERAEFIGREVVRPEQYQIPPNSVSLGPASELIHLAPTLTDLGDRDIALYQIGMTYLRSDPYTGMAILYAYLYCGGMANRTRDLILWMPNISIERWRRSAEVTPNAKHVRLFKVAADGIVFADGYLSSDQL